MKSKLFNLKLLDRRDYSTVHTFELTKVMDGGKLLGIISPAFPRHLFKESYLTGDLDVVVLSSRHEGYEIYPHQTEVPSYVNILLPKKGGDWDNGPFQIIDCGLLEVQKP